MRFWKTGKCLKKQRNVSNIQGHLSETTTNEKEHKMEDKKIEQAEEHLKEAEADLKIAKDATEAAEHKIDEALQEKWEAEEKGKA
jgi:septum formation inhibitor MinC